MLRERSEEPIDRALALVVGDLQRTTGLGFETTTVGWPQDDDRTRAIALPPFDAEDLKGSIGTTRNLGVSDVDGFVVVRQHHAADHYRDPEELAFMTVELAAEVQHLAQVTLWSARREPTWPTCAGHSHPRLARAVHQTAWWSCPASPDDDPGDDASRVGSLLVG